jgi:hypothetical protein
MNATAARSATSCLIAEANDAGRTEMRCLKCDAVDALKTDAAKWAESSLAQPPGS